MNTRKSLTALLAIAVVAGAIGCGIVGTDAVTSSSGVGNDPAKWEFQELTVFANGFSSPEGPCMDADGNLYFVEYGNGNIDRIAPDGTATVIAEIGIQNNGLTIDKDGNLYIGDWKGKTVYKLDTDGDVSVVTRKTASGDSLRGPNDFAWFNNGHLYMTDPKGSGPDNLIGLIHYFDTDMNIHPFDNGLCYPNGLAFSPDSKYLYVGETYFSHILRYEMNADGSYKSKEVFYYLGEQVWPDGMKCDKYGNLWIAAYSEHQVWCINPEGEKVAVLELPCTECQPTNILFSTLDPYEAYVTVGAGEDGRVYKTRMPVPGAPMLP
jgi:gluconolactonase